MFQVLIVAGGRRGDEKLSTTEKLTIGDSYWTTVKGLPRTLAFMGSVSMDNKVFLIGEFGRVYTFSFWIF